MFAYALYLLAKWRETRGYPYIIRWLSLPEEEPFDIAGDIVTQDGGRILAAVCNGNLRSLLIAWAQLIADCNDVSPPRQGAGPYGPPPCSSEDPASRRHDRA